MLEGDVSEPSLVIEFSAKFNSRMFLALILRLINYFLLSVVVFNLGKGNIFT